MLFDLRGRGRRRTVQAIYLGLALLMGGGLIFFGIGSNTSGGGLFDALGGGDGGGGQSGDKVLDQRLARAAQVARAHPRSPQPWAELARLRVQRAGVGNGFDQGRFTTVGIAKLQLAADAWEHYLELDPKHPSDRVARLMVQAYGAQGLNELGKAVRAQEIVAAAVRPPSSNVYAQLAVLAYQAGQTRIGDLASDRAVSLAPKTTRALLRTQLERIKTGGSSTKGQPRAPATTG